MSDTAAQRAASFAPVGAPNARVLILGSLPGVRSLQQVQYYAQPRNAFWSIMGQLCGAEPAMDYARRLARLQQAGIALWDVIASAQRAGSLDSNIDRATLEVNDFASFHRQHPALECVCFNGRTAAELFARRVALQCEPLAALPQHVLPSTSPAHAAMPVAEKTRRWLQVLQPFVAD